MALLGMKTILIGLRPEFARIAVNLGVDLSSLNTVANVQKALESLAVKKVV
ncbi:STAS domain-containing protein [Peribacillus glennii]|uniref:hypothetical protein n=1 Tax=Peribacillus glennii TaxID=2303991 RepID=UPI001F3FC653|nr:hypothetical protein [Peribacillus glennii]